MEVAGVQRFAPDRFVDGAQLGDGERFDDERGGQRRVLQLGSRPLEPVTDNLRMIERKLSGCSRPLVRGSVD